MIGSIGEPVWTKRTTDWGANSCPVGSRTSLGKAASCQQHAELVHVYRGVDTLCITIDPTEAVSQQGQNQLSTHSSESNTDIQKLQIRQINRSNRKM